jgi:ribosomal protein S18 acetylase RimI-like enzyme
VRVELVPATALDVVARARLFNAGYEDYFTPVHVDEAALAWMVEAWDVDLERSRIALRDGEPVGFANLALRGGLGWIGGVGVVKAARRSGVGRVLMEAVLAQAPGDVLLEVIDRNEPAIRLYEDLGFERTRVLEVWSLTAEPPPSSAREREPRLLEADAPWQRTRPSLDGLAALEVDGGAILFRPGEQVNVVQLAARDDHAARELLAAARARGASLNYVNVPVGHPASAALRTLGGSLDLRQYEMRLSSRTSAPRD